MIYKASPQTIQEAASLLKNAELVAFPTETVYGLGANASSEKAVKKIFEAKGRPSDHPLIVHIAHKEQLNDWASTISTEAQKLAEAFWPGPLTLILKRSSLVPDAVTGSQDTVGVRVPSHPVARALLEAFGGGVAAPSANRFGRISPTTAAHVEAEFGAGLFILDGGASNVGLESTIVDCSSTNVRVLRPGGVPVEAIKTVLGFEPVFVQKAEIRASGTLESHYAPVTPTFLVNSAPLDNDVAVLAYRPKPALFEGVWLELPNSAVLYGQGLYAALRELDALSVKAIYVEAVPNLADWLAVRDRLRRASFKETKHD